MKETNPVFGHHVVTHNRIPHPKILQERKESVILPSEEDDRCIGTMTVDQRRYSDILASLIRRQLVRRSLGIWIRASSTAAGEIERVSVMVALKRQEEGEQSAL